MKANTNALPVEVYERNTAPKSEGSIKKPELKIKNFSKNNTELYLDGKKIECECMYHRGDPGNTPYLIEFTNLGDNFQKIADMLWDCDTIYTEESWTIWRRLVLSRAYFTLDETCRTITVNVYPGQLTNISFYEGWPD